MIILLIVWSGPVCSYNSTSPKPIHTTPIWMSVFGEMNVRQPGVNAAKRTDAREYSSNATAVSATDLGNDTIAAKTGSVYDGYGNAAETTAKSLRDTVGPNAPTGASASAINASNQGDYNVSVTLPDDHEAGMLQLSLDGGAITTSTDVANGTDPDSSGDVVTFGGIDVTGLSEGSVSIDATFTDYGGNSNGASGLASVPKDTGRPTVTDASITNAPIGTYDAGTAQTVTVEFNESVDGSVGPTVEVTNLNRTYAVSGSFDDATTWTGTVTIADDETTTGNVTVTGAADALGNALVTANRSVSVDTETPSITEFDVARTDGGTVSVSFNASESLDSASVSLGTPSGTTTLSSFTESESGPYEYTATYSGGDDGSYTATLDAANDAAGNDGATGQSDTVTVDTTPPSFGNPTPDATTVTDDGTVLSVDIADTTGSVDGASIRVTVADANETRIDAVGTGHGGVS